MADAMQFQRNGNLARDHADDGDRDGVRGDALPAIGEEFGVLTLGDVNPARTAADQHARVRLATPQSCVVPRLGSGHDGDQRRLRVASRVCPGGVLRTPLLRRTIDDIDRIVHREPRHRRRHGAPQSGCIEFGDCARRAAPATHVTPESLTSNAIR
jgi:hypothetical protein